MFKFFKKNKLTEDDLNQIEEELLLADVAVETTDEIIKELKKNKFNKDISVEELKSFIKNILVNKLQPFEKSFWITNKPFVLLVFGTNGSGKTTTIAKLANYLHNLGLPKVLLAACDTFRTGATEQLQIWGERLNFPVYTNDKTKDPSAIAYGAAQKAIEEDFDALIIDTSGRFSNNKNLMEELQKIERTIKKINPDFPHESILVLDGTLGQSSTFIAEGFLNNLNITSLIITKLDGLSKGGSLIPITQKLKLPVLFIGVGEKTENIQPFNAEEFSKQIVDV